MACCTSFSILWARSCRDRHRPKAWWPVAPGAKPHDHPPWSARALPRSDRWGSIETYLIDMGGLTSEVLDRARDTLLEPKQDSHRDSPSRQRPRRSEGDDRVGLHGPLGELVEGRTARSIDEVGVVDAARIHARPAAGDRRPVASGRDDHAVEVVVAVGQLLAGHGARDGWPPGLMTRCPSRSAWRRSGTEHRTSDTTAASKVSSSAGRHSAWATSIGTVARWAARSARTRSQWQGHDLESPGEVGGVVEPDRADTEMSGVLVPPAVPFPGLSGCPTRPLSRTRGDRVGPAGRYR
jgi:hypothetical protein